MGRTIQSMKDVQSARVHIVLSEKGSFRKQDQKPSASVVIKASGTGEFQTAQAIRYLVAAAVPGMKPAEVTVLDSTGALLASGQGKEATSAGEMAGLEDLVSNRIQENIRKTLTPYLGLSNFQVSVAATLNTDKEHVAQTIFDPESRTERSVQTVRSSESAQNASSQPPTTVEQNLPDQQVKDTNSEQSVEENQRREETVNYEISTKKVEQTREGYDVERTVDCRSGQPGASSGNAGWTMRTTPTINSAINPSHRGKSTSWPRPLRGLMRRAATRSRLPSSTFQAGTGNLDPLPPLSVTQVLLQQSGNVVNAVSILLVSTLLIWFGLRPAISALVPKQVANDNAPEGLELEGELDEAVGYRLSDPSTHAGLIEELSKKLDSSPVRKLERVVEMNEEQSCGDPQAMVL